VYTRPVAQLTNFNPVENHVGKPPYQENLNFIIAKTTFHEPGHIYSVGEADDNIADNPTGGYNTPENV
jgi:hypothetical protein